MTVSQCITYIDTSLWVHTYIYCFSENKKTMNEIDQSKLPEIMQKNKLCLKSYVFAKSPFVFICNRCKYFSFCDFITFAQNTFVWWPKGKKKYKLANFSTEAEAIEAGWNITHKGHCGACSILQDLGVYIKQNLTSDTRRCGLEGIFLGKLSYQF